MKEIIVNKRIKGNAHTQQSLHSIHMEWNTFTRVCKIQQN